MTVDIRAARSEEMDEFRRVAAANLGTSPDIFKGVRPEYTLCAFQDGRLATSYAAWPLTMRFNGRALDAAGVTSVGTLPPYRRSGNLRRIVSRHFEMLHEEGQRPLAILLAAHTAIYQRYGYAVVSTRFRYQVDPRDIRFPDPPPAGGSLRELGPDEFQVLVDLYREFRRDRTGYIHRGRFTWEAGVLAPPPPSGALTRLVYEEGGRPLGYLVYATRPGPSAVPGPGQHLTVRDLVWLTPSAYRALWDCLGRLDQVDHLVWEWVPADDPLPHLLLEPRKLNPRAHDGLMGRIVDVDRALAGRCYPEDTALTFEVLDDLCPWNRGRRRLETSSEGGRVESTGKAPDVVLPVSTLAMLAFGQISASQAARMGRLEANRPEVLAEWDKALRTVHRPACADMF